MSMMDRIEEQHEQRIAELEAELAAEKSRADGLGKAIEAMWEELVAECRRRAFLEIELKSIRTAFSSSLKELAEHDAEVRKKALLEAAAIAESHIKCGEFWHNGRPECEECIVEEIRKLAEGGE